MKVKYIDESISKKVSYDKFIYEKINNDFFKGYIGLIDIGNISIDDYYVPRENREDDCIVSSNYKYLRIFLEDKNYAIIAVYSDNLEFIEFYIDVVNGVKIDSKKNLPYIEDLYLDIVYTYKDEIIILDEDELENAYLNMEINKDTYDNVLQIKDEILDFLDNKEYMDKLKMYCKNELDRLLAKL